MRVFALAAPCFLIAAGASAQQTSDAVSLRPEAVTRVFDCRTLQAAEERLACYDREVGALQAAEAAREVVVYDREQVRKTRRSLFGITLPNLNIFGGGDDDQEEGEGFTQIESTIRSITQDGRGRYLVTLEDGARWAQIDNRELSATPRHGQPIRIRRAAMGSYLANIGGNVAIRVRRVLPAD
jgi:hypothetical protein